MPQATSAEEFIARQKAAIMSNPECGVSHYNLAVALLGQQKFDEAEKELREAVDCSSNLAEAYVQLGGLCLRKGDLDGCLEYNKMAIHSRAGFSEGYGNIGFVHLQKGNLEEAIRALEKAVQYNPNFIQAKATLANAYLMDGKIAESIKQSKDVLEFEPSFAVAHNNLCIAYMENGQFDMAVEHCDKAVSLGYAVAPQILEELKPHR